MDAPFRVFRYFEVVFGIFEIYDKETNLKTYPRGLRS